MAPRKKKRTPARAPVRKKPVRRKKSGVGSEISLYVFIVIGILMMLSIFSQNTAGLLGGFTNVFMQGLLGIGAYLLPFIIIGGSLYFLFTKQEDIPAVKKTAGVFLLLSLIAAVHVMTMDPEVKYDDLSAYMSAYYKNGGLTNGGLVGALVGNVLFGLAGKLGANIILIVVGIISTMMLTGQSFFEMVGQIVGFLKEFLSLTEYEEVYEDDDDYDYEEEEVERPVREKPPVREAPPIRPKQTVRAKSRPTVVPSGRTGRQKFRASAFVIEEPGPEKRREKSEKRILLIDEDARKLRGPNPILAPRDKRPEEDVPHPVTSRTQQDIKLRGVFQEDEEYDGEEYDNEEYENEEERAEVYVDTARYSYDYEPGIYAPEEKRSAGYEPEEEYEADVYEPEEEYAPQIFESRPYVPEEERIFDLDNPPFAEEADEAFVVNPYVNVEAKTKPEPKPEPKPELKPEPKPVAAKPQKEAIPVSLYNPPPSRKTPPPVVVPSTASVAAPPREYIFPSINMLNKSPVTSNMSSRAQILENSRKLEDTLKSFGVEAKVIEVSKGPTVTRYELSPGMGVKVSKISNLADDLALNLAAEGIRIEAPIPGKAAVGIEVPNKEVQTVYLREVLDDPAFKNFPSKLAFGLGKDIAGNTVVWDIGKMPHLLIAGATGAGKSVCINTLITSIIYKARPDEVKLLMVDPKVVELSIYNGIPHLLIPVVTDPKKAAGALNWAVAEMITRYNLFAETSVRDLKSYNAIKTERGETDLLPQIVIIVDELADLMMAAPGEVEDAICRLAQMARAAGLHLIIATQRPSVDVITGLIKANVPSRLAFAVSSGTDSRTILDMVGAEKLLGKGDMLFCPVGMGKPLRIQGAFISDKEVEGIVSFLKENLPEGFEPNQEMVEKITSSGKTGDTGGDSDEFFDEAVTFVIQKEKASASMLQRQFRIGYNRASRLIEDLEAKGIVGPEDGSKPRKVLITMYEWNMRQAGEE